MDNKSWNSSYSIGIPIIDRQHEEIFDIYDQIVSISDLQKKYQDDEIKKVLYNLEDFLKVHFKIEEELLIKANYPHIEQHIQQHQYFIEKVDEFVLSFQSDNPFLLKIILDFLKKWLLSHIMHSDFVYKDYIAPVME